MGRSVRRMILITRMTTGLRRAGRPCTTFRDMLEFGTDAELKNGLMNVRGHLRFHVHGPEPL